MDSLKVNPKKPPKVGFVIEEIGGTSKAPRSGRVYAPEENCTYIFENMPNAYALGDALHFYARKDKVSHHTIIEKSRVFIPNVQLYPTGPVIKEFLTQTKSWEQFLQDKRLVIKGHYGPYFIVKV